MCHVLIFSKCSRNLVFVIFPPKENYPIEKPAPPGQGVPVFTIGDQPIARRGLKLLCRLESDHFTAYA
jgi:hypothetical protein